MRLICVYWVGMLCIVGALSADAWRQCVDVWCDFHCGNTYALGGILALSAAVAAIVHALPWIDSLLPHPPSHPSKTDAPKYKF